MPRVLSQRPDVEVFAEIGLIDLLSTNMIDRLLPAGLTSAQFSVLNHLATHGREESPASLVEVFMVTKGAMTNILQRLEGRDLISVTTDPADARRKRVAITPDGRLMFCANMVGGNVAVFRIDAATGQIVPASAPTTVRKPACIALID